MSDSGGNCQHRLSVLRVDYRRRRRRTSTNALPDQPVALALVPAPQSATRRPVRR